jgi:hypothetical protein
MAMEGSSEQPLAAPRWAARGSEEGCGLDNDLMLWCGAAFKSHVTHLSEVDQGVANG